MNSEKDFKEIFFFFYGRSQLYVLFSITGTFPFGTRDLLVLTAYCVCSTCSQKDVKHSIYNTEIDGKTHPTKYGPCPFGLNFIYEVCKQKIV